VANLEGAGLMPVSTNAGPTAAAIADMNLATIYARQGNAAASSLILKRAAGLDSTVSSQIAKNNGLVLPKVQVKLSKAVPVAAAVATRAATDVTAAVQVTLPITVLAQRQVGFVTGSSGGYSVKTLQWPDNGSPDISSIKDFLYTPHITATVLPDALGATTTLWERAASLPYDYFYVIPLALAACYRAMGDFVHAETNYLIAASFPYINLAVEGPYVWVQLATLYRDWGNNLYQGGDPATADLTYSNVITYGSTTAPTTPLYTLAGLATASSIAKALLPQLPVLGPNGIATVSPDDVSIATVLLQVYGRLSQINANLDYFGNYAPSVPMWTFIYLQQVAINFTQLAQQMQQSVISYWTQADQGNLTQSQLLGQASQAANQVAAAQQALNQSLQQSVAYADALTLANTRANDAAADAANYSTLNSYSIYYQSISSMDAQGDSPSGLYGADWGPLGYSTPPGPITGATIADAAANPGDNTAQGALDSWKAAAFSQIYQVASMQMTATEMQLAAVQAQAELAAAMAQVSVSQTNVAIAQLQANSALQTLNVFNSDNFTPQVWQTMGNFALGIYEQYMATAMSIAKLMEKAYNFENDANVAFIQDFYPGTMSWINQPAGLLGADSLMADIQSFTSDQIFSNRGKKQLVKTSLSLAGRNGYLFETQLRTTGSMSFETTLADFDMAFPGSYQSRIKSVSVSVQGLVPPTGISGALTNGGISTYRLPSDIATDSVFSKIRLQNSETLVLSDYSPSVDGVIDSTDSDMPGIFEGAGVASSWNLSLPLELNDFDFSTLTDVVVTILFEARFDAQLVPTVLADLASRPGFYARERMIPIGWVFPDLFFAFQASGNLTMPLAATDFPFNQTAPVITAIALLVASASASPASGITVTFTAPGKAAVTGVTDASGTITSLGAGSPWAGAVGGSALGNWVISITAAANPALAPGGTLDLSSIGNLTLVLDYNFTPRS
jgi:hypothetical protein